MLVLSRNRGQKIAIGDGVVITVVRIDPNTVRIGIEAPRDMNIVRQELAEPACQPRGGGLLTVGGEMATEDIGSSVLARQLRGEHP